VPDLPGHAFRAAEGQDGDAPFGQPVPGLPQVSIENLGKILPNPAARGVDLELELPVADHQRASLGQPGLERIVDLADEHMRDTQRAVSASEPSRSLMRVTRQSWAAKCAAFSSTRFSIPGPGVIPDPMRRVWFFSSTACRICITRLRLRCGFISVMSVSLNTRAPTRSPASRTRQAPSAAVSAAVTDFMAVRLPKNMDNR
jgi:hypothetical protein